jgi:Tfp pilus assembly protein PilO
MFGYLPIARQKLVLRESMRRQSVTLEQIRVQSRQLPELEKKVESLELKTAEFDAKVPQERQFAQLWQTITQIMNEHRLSNQLVQPGEEIRGEPVSRMELTLQCSGTFEDVFELFRSLEQMDRLVRIERVQLKNDESFSGQVSVAALASVYFQTNDNKNG